MSQLNRIALAVAAMMAVPAFAATATAPAALGTIYGGGATLPAGAYVGNKWLTFSPAHRLNVTSTSKKILDAVNPADPTSLFGNMSWNNSNTTKLWKISYCATGSGTGRKVLDGVMDGTGACGDYSATPAGFSASKASADFAASDAPFSATEYATFVTGTRQAAKTALVQFPAVAGAIGIVVNNADLGSLNLNLTESQICQIFSGQINNWNQIISTLPSKPIVPVVRSDSSGTSFSFTNHLSAVCPSAAPVSVAGYATSSTFASGAVGGALPTGALGASGNGGVVTTVLATDGAIGYAEINDGRARAALAGGKLLRYATVSIKPDVAAYTENVQQFNADGTPVMKNGLPVVKLVKHKAVTYVKFDPLKNMPTSVAVSATSDMALGANDGNGRPTLVALTPAAATAAGCMQLVDPAVYAKPALNAKNDYVQYPIIAVSYLMGYNTGNAEFVDATGATVASTDKADAVRALFKAPYGIASNIKTIGKNTGFGALTVTLDSAAGATSMSALVDKCVTN